MKINILTFVFCLFSIQTIAQEEEKTFNYFVGFQPSYSNDITGETGFFQYDNYWNYTNKGGYSIGLAIQNGVSLKKWTAILDVGFSQKYMNQTYGFFDGWVPVSFGEVSFQIPYFKSEFSFGRKIKISKENSIQLTLGYGIEKNLKTDFSGDFNNPKDAKVYYQYSSVVSNKVNNYLKAKVAFIMPFGRNELLFGVSLSSIVEERLTMRIEVDSNTPSFARTTIGYRRQALGIFLTYRFL